MSEDRDSTEEHVEKKRKAVEVQCGLMRVMTKKGRGVRKSIFTLAPILNTVRNMVLR